MNLFYLKPKQDRTYH